MTQTPEHLIPFLKIISKHDFFGEAIWDIDFKNISLICNDLFYWGCADAEKIESIEDVNLLDQCGELVSSFNAIELFCCKKRGQRPQGALYKYIKEEHRHFFDECGPEREINLGNPYNTLGKYLYNRNSCDE
jgi:hypothetical protein